MFCPDEEESGGGRRAYERAALELMLAAPAIVAPRGYLDGCKDLSEYWQAHRALPPVLADLTFARMPDAEALYAPQSDESTRDDSYHPSACPLTPELAALLKPEWFTEPVPVHLLTWEEGHALARCGRSYEVTGAPLKPTNPEHLPAACIGGLACAALGPCPRAPYCRLGNPHAEACDETANAPRPVSPR